MQFWALIGSNPGKSENKSRKLSFIFFIYIILD